MLYILIARWNTWIQHNIVKSYLNLKKHEHVIKACEILYSFFEDFLNPFCRTISYLVVCSVLKSFSKACIKLAHSIKHNK